MQRYSLYIFDLDGTLNRGDDPIPYAAETVKTLQSEGAQIRYVTNNATQTRDYFVSKLQRLGFNASPKEVESSGTVAASYCGSNGIKRVGILGEEGLAKCLIEEKIEIIRPDDVWPHELDLQGKLIEAQAQKKLDAVVIGLFRTCTYQHISKAMQTLASGAQFIATNRDSTFPVEGNRFIPGSGAMVAALETCSGIKPVVVGKPNPFLIEKLMKEAGCSGNETLVVGDRLDTDIESGIRAKAQTFLVLTGVEKSAPNGQLSGNDLRSLL